MTPNERLYRGATRIFGGVILTFGIVIVIRTLAAGGGPFSVGVLIGLVFCALGGGRLYLASRSRTEGEQ